MGWREVGGDGSGAAVGGTTVAGHRSHRQRTSRRGQLSRTLCTHAGLSIERKASVTPWRAPPRARAGTPPMFPLTTSAEQSPRRLPADPSHPQSTRRAPVATSDRDSPPTAPPYTPSTSEPTHYPLPPIHTSRLRSTATTHPTNHTVLQHPRPRSTAMTNPTNPLRPHALRPRSARRYPPTNHDCIPPRTSSTKRARRTAVTVAGRRSTAENSSASRTVACNRGVGRRSGHE